MGFSPVHKYSGFVIVQGRRSNHRCTSSPRQKNVQYLFGYSSQDNRCQHLALLSNWRRCFVDESASRAFHLTVSCHICSHRTKGMVGWKKVYQIVLTRYDQSMLGSHTEGQCRVSFLASDWSRRPGGYKIRSLCNRRVSCPVQVHGH